MSFRVWSAQTRLRPALRDGVKPPQSKVFAFHVEGPCPSPQSVTLPPQC